MANTFYSIGSTTLGSSSTTITFSSIPQTYTDLKLVLSLKSNYTSGNEAITSISFNGSSADMEQVYLFSLGAGGSSIYNGNDATVTLGYCSSSSSSTTDCFSSQTVYLSNYTTSNQKNWFVMANALRYSATVTRGLFGGRWKQSAAISSITINCGQGSFVANSSAYLYGIKNS